ncbi:hypothetical protein K1719_043492 [Acacia pycnantha]|nr:hypothetical protein K1719_043492 [Acacia pycnantha]
MNEEEWPSLGKQGGRVWEAGATFAEKLQGIDLNRGERNDDKDGCNHQDNILSEGSEHDPDMEDNEPVCVITEDENRNFPEFSFSEKMTKRLHKSWRWAVIVKLLGRDIGYKSLLSILQTLWAKRGVISVINVGNGFFVVKLSNKEDYLNALTGGPWMLFDHYLTVEKTKGILGMKEVPAKELDTWKVVKRANWKKKGGKDRLSIQANFQGKGSRFEVLVEEGIGKKDAERVSKLALAEDLQDVGRYSIRGVDVGENLRINQSVQSVRGKKSGGGKKKGKGKKVVDDVVRQEVEFCGKRTDKRVRQQEEGQDAMKKIGDGTIEKEEKGVGPADEVVEDCGLGSMEVSINSVGPTQRDDSINSIVPNTHMDPGDSRLAIGLAGKFWAGPTDVVADCDMVEEVGPELIGKGGGPSAYLA